MSSNCQGVNSYECADGTCASREGKCPFKDFHQRTCDITSDYNFLCPDGECAKSDAGCLRRCGTNVNGERYTHPCSGYTTCIADNGHQCPPVCDGDSPYKCPSRKCVKNENFCKICYGFQCSNGDCISWKKRCDDKNDCADGSDETLRLCHGGAKNYARKSVNTDVVIALVAVSLVVIVAVFVIVFLRKRYRRNRENRDRRGMRSVAGGGVTAQPMMTSPPPNPYRDKPGPNPYQDQPSNRPSAPQQPDEYVAPYNQADAVNLERTNSVRYPQPPGPGKFPVGPY